MSRAYRIRISESLRKIIRAADHVGTDLELLEILPEDQMAELLGEELSHRGFERQGRQAVRTSDGITVTVDVDARTVTVQSETCEDLELEAERDGRVYGESDDIIAQEEENLRQKAVEDMECQADAREAELQQQATDRLEAELSDLRDELDQAVNRVTAEALKRKAAQIGHIKEMSEDLEAGSLTIVVEV